MFVPFLAFAITATASSEETYIGLYIQGNRIGVASYAEVADTSVERAVKRMESRTQIGTRLLGSAMRLSMESTSWIDAKGQPIRMRFHTESAGRVQIANIDFRDGKAHLDISNAGQKSKRELPVPTDAPIVDDPLPLVLNGPPAASRAFYILDPTTLSFVKNEVRLVGPGKTTIDGKEVSATQVRLVDPRADTIVWLNAKGDFLKGEGPMGIEMRPITREEALTEAPEVSPSTVDLAEATRIVPSPRLNNPASLTRLRLNVEGRDLSRVPSDSHQTVRKEGDGWIVHVHPVPLRTAESLPIVKASAAEPTWTEPSLHIPSNSPEFAKLAKEIVGNAKDVKAAMSRIRAYVYGRLRPNAGIGVLRDASEVLSSREGVCRDYAILTATIARAAGIPTKLASGLVSWDGDFYYHAWVEVYTGRQWIAYDSTQSTDQVSAAHVKLAEGNVDDAFVFTFLGNVRIRVLNSQ
jgi:hypothetical protein